jgi:hypothetical protein
MILCATTLAVLLVIGGVEENPGPVVETEKKCEYCAVDVTEF